MMSDKEQQQRERAYQIWEEEGRPDGAHEDHWNRAAQTEDLGKQEDSDVTKANQEADEEFGGKNDSPPSVTDIWPPSSVAPD